MEDNKKIENGLEQLKEGVGEVLTNQDRIEDRLEENKKSPVAFDSDFEIILKPSEESKARSNTMAEVVSQVSQDVAKLTEAVSQIPELNIPEYKPVVMPESFKVSNLSDIKFPAYPEMPDYPTSMKLDKPTWWTTSDNKDIVKALKPLDNNLDKIHEGLHSYKDPVKVNILDSKGNVINKFGGTFSGGGSGGGTGSVEAIKVDSAISNTNKTVANASTTVLAANKLRRKFILSNDSDEVMYVFYGATAEMNKGYRLNASGGSIAEESYRGIVTAICTSGGKNMTIIEI